MKENPTYSLKELLLYFLNITKTINPALFIYFSENFDFINKMNSRYGDISRNILNPIITDPNCLTLILENSSSYIDTINKAGDDAEDLKVNIRQLLTSNKSAKLPEFAAAIGILKDEDKKEKK
jgi:hypothetical protein